MPTTEQKVYFVGTGGTTPTRRIEMPETDLIIEACRMAAEDAGLDPSEIDGIHIAIHHYPEADIPAIAKGLGMKEVRWQSAGFGTSITPASAAAQALDANLCNTVMVCKVMNTVAPNQIPPINPIDGGVAGPEQFDVPYGEGMAAHRVAFVIRRYMHRYGITPEQLAWVSIVTREHALMNPRAYMKSPLTMEDYFNSRWIAEPVRLLDCDIPVNCATAYVMTREDRARDLRQKPVSFVGWAESGARMPDYRQAEILEGLSPVGTTLYADTGLSPKDMDLWYLYDGESFMVPLWMENLGLVPRGEAGRYVEGGDRIRYTGEHPLNTHGGNLSEGRTHASGQVMEAIHQLRGTAGPRQVKNVDYAILSGAFPSSGPAGILGKGF